MGSLRTRRKPHRARLQVEQLESRLVPAGIQPTNLEQLMLEQLNDARADPAAYGQSIGVDLSTVAPSPPLAFDPLLIAAALGHSEDMSTNNYFSHTGSDGSNPGQRISAQGFSYSDWAESIAAGYNTTADALAGLITDAGVPDLGHRLQLLSIGSAYQQTEVGIGIVMNSTGQYSDYYTIDGAMPQGGGVFLTGCVFDDTSGNGQYAIGEGLSGVTIAVAGGPSTTSFASGGYTLQVAPGTYTVTASGGGLAAPITQTVTVGTVNVRLQFIEEPGSAGGGSTASSGSTGGVSSAQHTADVAFVNQLFQTDLMRAPTATELNTYSTELDNGQATQASLTAMVKSSPEFANVSTVWLQQVYTDMLGRTISSGELSFWLQNLQGAGTFSSVATAVVTSPEYQQRQWASWVQNTYQTYLNRSASPAEVAIWTPYFQSGWTESNLVAAVVASPEYQNDVGASNTQFVTALYQNMLGRASSAAELGAWVNALNGGLGRSAVIAGFLGSAEYQARQYNLELNQLYDQLLGRSASSQEIAAWSAALSSGVSFATVEVDFLTSQEYYNRAAAN